MDALKSSMFRLTNCSKPLNRRVWAATRLSILSFCFAKNCSVEILMISDPLIFINVGSLIVKSFMKVNPINQQLFAATQQKAVCIYPQYEYKLIVIVLPIGFVTQCFGYVSCGVL